MEKLGEKILASLDLDDLELERLTAAVSFDFPSRFDFRFLEPFLQRSFEILRHKFLTYLQSAPSTRTLAMARRIMIPPIKLITEVLSSPLALRICGISFVTQQIEEMSRYVGKVSLPLVMFFDEEGVLG